MKVFCKIACQTDNFTEKMIGLKMICIFKLFNKTTKQNTVNCYHHLQDVSVQDYIYQGWKQGPAG